VQVGRSKSRGSNFGGRNCCLCLAKLRHREVNIETGNRVDVLLLPGCKTVGE
jgi:hypothetical protein